jgi:hypothetical protein
MTVESEPVEVELVVEVTAAAAGSTGAVIGDCVSVFFTTPCSINLFKTTDNSVYVRNNAGTDIATDPTVFDVRLSLSI